MIRLRIALRNTLRQPRRTFLLSGAIALGVVVICLAVGFTAGMEKAVQANVTLFSAGHIIVHGSATSETGRVLNRISDPLLSANIKKILPGAKSISPTAQAQATVVFGSREQQLRIRGVEWNEDRLYTETLILTQGDWAEATAERSIVLGLRSAERFGLGLGDSVFVRLSTVTGQQNVTEYNLGAVYDDTAAGGMSTALVPLPNLLADLNMKDGQYQSLAIFLADASTADQYASHVIQELASSNAEGYRVTTVTEMSGQMGAVLGSVRWIGLTVFSIMLVLTMAGITNTYRMVLMERTKEIGMLRCIGFKRVDVFRIFLYEALLIAIAGSVAGIGASLPIGFLIQSIRFDTAGPLGAALSRGRLIFSPDGISLFILSVSVVLSSAIAVYGPARRASRLLPVEALRTTA